MKPPASRTLLAAAIFAPALAAMPRLPLLADAPPRFVPEGWRLGDAAESDYNGDGKVDIAWYPQRRRALAVVALGEGKGLKRNRPGRVWTRTPSAMPTWKRRRACC
jgi:hypothetical protein